MGLVARVASPTESASLAPKSGSQSLLVLGTLDEGRRGEK